MYEHHTREAVQELAGGLDGLSETVSERSGWFALCDHYSRKRTNCQWYPLPIQGYSDVEDARLAHKDLARLDALQLWREKRLCELAIALNPEADPWYVERYAKIRQEQARRKRMVSYER